MKKNVRRFLSEVGKALVNRSYSDVVARCASWVDAGALESELVTKERAVRDEFDDEEIGEPDGFEIDDNPISLAELREDEFGSPLPESITDDNFESWTCVIVSADDEEWTLSSLWIAVVRVGDSLAIGHYEVADPD